MCGVCHLRCTSHCPVNHYGAPCFIVIAIVAVLTDVTASSKPSPTEQPISQCSRSDCSGEDLQSCQEQATLRNINLKRFEALPGIGWDNLRNVETGQVVSYSYRKCKLIGDGEMLIPDNVFTLPIKSSVVDVYGEVIEHWQNASSATSRSINLGAGMGNENNSISGSFSDEKTQIKSNQVKDNTKTIRVQLRYHRYDTKLQLDPVLSESFKDRLLSIAANIELNYTEQARYEAQLLVRDFGTHIITRVLAGAALVKDDYVTSTFLEDHKEDRSAIMASASASYMKTFKMNFTVGGNKDKTMDSRYSNEVKHSIITTHGGPSVYQVTDMATSDWAEQVDKNLVALDRDGDPLYFLIMPKLLPELSTTTVASVQKIVQEAIEIYYAMNVIPGCTKIGAPNFSLSANFDDGSCHSSATSVQFGGVYQTCRVYGTYLEKDPCNGLTLVNPKTGSYSCPPSYTAVLLHERGSERQVEKLEICKKHKYLSLILKDRCKEEQYVSYATYSSYWCAALGPVEPNSGYLFGGLYTPYIDNPVTGGKNCPSMFYAFKLLRDLNICLGDDFELGESHSFPFAGFFSCSSGNPLAAYKTDDSKRTSGESSNSLKSCVDNNAGHNACPSRCPTGYSQHMATTDNGCSIHYCVMSGYLSSPILPPVKRPPFVSRPSTIIYDAGNLGSSKSSTDDEDDTMSPGVAAGISVVVTLACVVLATLIVALIQRRCARGRGKRTRLVHSHDYY